MAVKTCMKPPVSFVQTTGQFYSQYADLPLKSCRVDLPVNQSGSGTPSPTNIRDFIPYTALDFTANGTVKTFTFGQTVYSAILDVLTGKLSITHEIKTIDENSDLAIINGILVYEDFFEIDNDTTSDSYEANVYVRAENKQSTSGVMNINPDYSFCCKEGSSPISFVRRLMIKDTRYTSVEDYKAWLANNPVKIAVKLAEPTIIQLTPMQIKTLLGQNNLISSVGTIDAKYIKFGR